MDLLTFITSLQVREVSATAVLVAVVVMVLTGRLVPRRHLVEALKERDAWKSAHAESERVRSSLNAENFKLLETARISDQFYRDFLPAIGSTQPKIPQRSTDDDMAV